MLTFVFIKHWEQRAIAYFIYVLVFYTLSVVTVFCVMVLPKQYGKIKKKILANPFYNKLKAAKMKQSMSRVAKCIDNGPMEGFWGILKRERYYGKRFTSRDDLVSMIENYITYYNNRRVQRNLGVLTPMEKHESYLMAA